MRIGVRYHPPGAARRFPVWLRCDILAEERTGYVMSQDRRRDPRYNVQVKVELFRDEKKLAELSTQNISISGLFLFHPKGFPVGDFISLRLHLGQNVASIMGEIVHSIPDVGIGIRFFDVDAKNTEILEKFLSNTRSYDPA
jgi:hypothetical protein